MAHPSQYYIKFLLVNAHCSKIEESDIYNILNDLELPKLVDPPGLDAIKRKFRIPASVDIDNKDHLPTIEFMRTQRLYSIWNPRGEDSDIFDFISSIKIRETVQILLMGGFNSNEISERVSMVHKISKPISPRIIDMFKHYFWNTEFTSASEWHNCLWTWSDSDKYLSSLFGKNQALFKLGLPVEVSGTEALKSSFEHIYFRIEATRHHRNDRDLSDMLSRLTRELVNLYNAVYGNGVDMKSTSEGLKDFILTDNNKKIPDAKTLILDGGSISGTGAKNAKVNIDVRDEEVGGRCEIENGRNTA